MSSDERGSLSASHDTVASASASFTIELEWERTEIDREGLGIA